MIPLLLSVALAAPEPRYHAILLAHDDLTMVTTPDGVPVLSPSGAPQYFYPKAGAGRDVARERIDPAALVPSGSAPCAQRTPYTLCAVARDQARMEDLLLLYADPALVTTLSATHEGPPLLATERAPWVVASTVEQAERAFTDTRCRIGLLRGQQPEGCEGVSLPERLAARSPGDAEDIVFVHFSGHGLPSGLVLRNGVIDPTTFEGWVQSLGADLVVLFIDACHGAGLTDRDPARPRDPEDEARVFLPRLYLRGPLEAPRDVALFNAASHYRLPEVEALRSGMLTHLILSGLMGAADDDGDRRIEFAELSAFFEVNTTGAGEFEGRTAAPGGDRSRVLLDLSRARRAVHVLEVDRGLGGRLLVAEREGAIAEVNVQRRILGKSRQVRLHLSRPVNDLYFLDLSDARSPSVRVERAWDLSRERGFLHSFEGEDALGADAIAEYLQSTQAQRRMFTSHALPVTEWRPGPHLSVQGRFGYHWSETFGRTEDDDVQIAAGLDDELADAGYTEGENEELYQYLQESGTPSWNLMHMGLVLRAHGLWFGLAELRAGLSLAPRTVAQLHEGSTVFMGRVAGGLGLSSYLGNPAALATLSAGTGFNYAFYPNVGQGPAEPKLGPDFPRGSPSDWGNWYAAASLRLDLAQVRPMILEVLLLNEKQFILENRCKFPDAATPYQAWMATLGFEIGRIPR